MLLLPPQWSVVALFYTDLGFQLPFTRGLVYACYFWRDNWSLVDFWFVSFWNNWAWDTLNTYLGLLPPRKWRDVLNYWVYTGIRITELIMNEKREVILGSKDVNSGWRLIARIIIHWDDIRWDDIRWEIKLDKTLWLHSPPLWITICGGIIPSAWQKL
jgi:hypothetical protein